MTKITCEECRCEIDEDEIIWVEPITGAASQRFGEPYHMKCAPNEIIDTEDFELLVQKIEEAARR